MECGGTACCSRDVPCGGLMRDDRLVAWWWLRDRVGMRPTGGVNGFPTPGNRSGDSRSGRLQSAPTAVRTLPKPETSLLARRARRRPGPDRRRAKGALEAGVADAVEAAVEG